MKTFIRTLFLMGISSLILVSCQKEVSFEQGNTRVAVGILLSGVTGDCTGATVSGTYYKDSTLNSTHFVDISVVIDTAGSYSISTDTVNGYSFNASGNLTGTGTQVIRLKAVGKPLASGTNIFTVTFNGTTCEFSITVNVGTGGTSVFTVSCTSPVINGTYEAGSALSASNTVMLNVNVTTIGTWSVTTAPAVNGIIFNGSGSFTATGAQTITLTGSGTPTAAGSFSFTVTGATAPCSFNLTVTAAPDYFPRVTFNNWSYFFDGDQNDSLLLNVIAPTHTAAGNTYKIFMYNDGATVDTFGYYRKNGNDYFEWIDMGDYIGFDNSMWLEYNFLKDNLNAGGNWNTQGFTGTVMGTPVTARFYYTIIQKDVPIVVNTVSYPNTIVVKEEIQTFNGVTWQTLTAAGYNQNYYSRDKGLIKFEYYDGMGVLGTKMELRRFAVY